MKKLTQEQLKRYQDAQEAKAIKGRVKVDEMHRKNLQAWIPYDLWTSIRTQVAKEGVSMNKYVEQALATYLLLTDEDVEKIIKRHQN